MLPFPVHRSLSIAISGAVWLVVLYFHISHTVVPNEASKYLSGSSKSASLDDIFNSTLGFEKIIVIGLPARTDRRDGFVLSAALSNLEFEFVEGVLGKDVADRAIPVGSGEHIRMSDPVIGSWRAHMNAIQMVIQQNLSSVLILEDDADWDLRLRQQMYDLAQASRALLQPHSESPSSYADSAFPMPKEAISPAVSDLQFDNLPSTIDPKHSPYGDNWDLIWTGHCGMRFPSEKVAFTEKIPKARVVIPDLSVPQQQYLKTISIPDEVKEQYPNHTRIVHHAAAGSCSLGYAITQAGARRLLHDIGLFDVTAPYDMLLRQFCEGSGGRKYHVCLAMQPAIFQHHRPAGPQGADGKGYRDKAVTENIRYSTRMNWDVLLERRTDFEDQYPDI